MIEDRLFLSTGYEQDQMEAAIINLELEKDKEYQEMERECMEAAKKIIQEAAKDRGVSEQVLLEMKQKKE